jgi:hypothetical protein
MIRSLIATAMFVATFLTSVPASAQETTPLSVLFIGNSYTLFNDLPGTVAAMGRGTGVDLIADTCAVGGKSLAWHVRQPETLAAIASRSWDIIVLQDHSLVPSLPPEELLEKALPALHELAELIRNNSPTTRIVLYETWGRRETDRPRCRRDRRTCTFDGRTAALQNGYRAYAEEIGAEIARVGTNWHHVVRDTSTHRPFAAARLWLNDGSHPSSLGSYLAAATILRTIAGTSVTACEYAEGIPDEVATYLRHVADAGP